nr:MAG TPA: hypothetical protein [Caudoviricetes sp.]
MRASSEPYHTAILQGSLCFFNSPYRRITAICILLNVKFAV